MNQILTYNSTAPFETSYTLLLLVRPSCTYGMASATVYVASATVDSLTTV